MAAILFFFGLEKKRLLEVPIWVFLSIGMNCMLSVAAYRPGRSMIGMSVFLIISDGILLSMVYDHSVLFEKDNWGIRTAWLCRILIGYIAVFMIYQLVYLLPGGVADIHSSWIQLIDNENYIKEQIEKGELDITIPVIESSTHYSAVGGLKYIDTTTSESWPNETMAKYYGAKSIIGRE